MNAIRQTYRNVKNRFSRLFNRRAIRETIAPPMVSQGSDAMMRPADAAIGKTRERQTQSKGPSPSTRLRKAIKLQKKVRRFRNQNLATGYAG
ncbi:MAG: hypothetical protein V4690_04045 [Patescibacteria group bacterium]